MKDDAIEARIALYANFPRVTHKVICEGVCIGHVYDNGAIVIDEPAREGTPPGTSTPLMTDA